jgi:hypothetical protein
MNVTRLREVRSIRANKVSHKDWISRSDSQGSEAIAEFVPLLYQGDLLILALDLPLWQRHHGSPGRIGIHPTILILR